MGQKWKGGREEEKKKDGRKKGNRDRDSPK